MQPDVWPSGIEENELVPMNRNLIKKNTRFVKSSL